VSGGKRGFSPNFPPPSLNRHIAISLPSGEDIAAKSGSGFLHDLSGYNWLEMPGASSFGSLFPGLNPLPPGPLWRCVPPCQQFVKKIFRQKTDAKKTLPSILSIPTDYLFEKQ
jgi:hypothetical protein